MDEPQNHIQWKKPDRKGTFVWFHSLKILENAIYSDRKQILGPGLGEERTAKEYKETFEGYESALCILISWVYNYQNSPKCIILKDTDYNV